MPAAHNSQLERKSYDAVSKPGPARLVTASCELVVVTPPADGEAGLIAVTPVHCFTEPMEYITVSAGQS